MARGGTDREADLFTTIDFRMNGSALSGDRPAGRHLYENASISSTDLHPLVTYVRPGRPAPWEARRRLGRRSPSVAERFEELAKTHLGVRRDLVAAPLLHDTPEELAQPGGVVRDWKAGERDRCREDDAQLRRRRARLRHRPRQDDGARPPRRERGIAWKGISWKPAQEVEELRHRNGAVRGGVADERPQLRTASTSPR